MATITEIVDASSMKRLSLSQWVLITASLYLVYKVELAVPEILKSYFRLSSTDYFHSSYTHFFSRRYDTFQDHGMPACRSFLFSTQHS